MCYTEKATEARWPDLRVSLSHALRHDHAVATVSMHGSCVKLLCVRTAQYSSACHSQYQSMTPLNQKHATHRWIRLNGVA